MKKIGKWWLPDDEQLMINEIELNGSWHPDRLAAAINALPLTGRDPYNIRTAIDCGAHVGMWTIPIAERSRNVLSFEPVQDTFCCLLANLTEIPDHVRYRIRPIMAGIGDKVGHAISIADDRYVGNSGGSWLALNRGPKFTIPIVKIDDFAINDLDFIKIDVEGMEPFAIRGAIDTLMRCRPVICWENKPVLGQRYGWERGEPERLLTGLGAQLLLPETKGHDEVWGWPI